MSSDRRENYSGQRQCLQRNSRYRRLRDIQYGMKDYVGINWGSGKIPDTMTIGAFKKMVEETIEKAFGKKIDCNTCEDSWYNG